MRIDPTQLDLRLETARYGPEEAYRVEARSD